MLKYVLTLTVALVLSISGAIGLSRDSTASRPTPPVVVAGTTGPQAVAALEEQVRRVPGDHRAWADLGLAYLDLAGTTLDPDHFRRADAAVARSLEVLPRGNVAALANGAAISASHHRFDEALEQADAALALAPHDPVALGIRVDALTQLGRYRQQLKAVRTADRRQPSVGTTSRYSYAVELRGDLQHARALLMRATTSASRAELAHLLSHAAGLDIRLGRLERAEALLERALTAVPDDPDSLVGLARLDTARGDLEGASERWQEIAAANPLPENYIALGETQEALGRSAEAEAAYRQSLSAVRGLEAVGANIDLELALFLADHGDATESLALARAEWQRSRGVHAADGMAWALHANGRAREALRFARLATRLGTQEPVLWAHRGIIEASLGSTAAAETHLRAALAMDPGQSPWQRSRTEEALEAIPAAG